MRLLNRTPLNILRKEYGESYLLDGKLIESNVETVIPIRGSLQPFNEGKKRVRLPEGVNTRGAYLLYTKSKLNTSDTILDVDADEVVIDGVRYEFFSEANWNRFGLRTDHYSYLLLRKDKK